MGYIVLEGEGGGEEAKEVYHLGLSGGIISISWQIRTYIFACLVCTLIIYLFKLNTNVVFSLSPQVSMAGI